MDESRTSEVFRGELEALHAQWSDEDRRDKVSNGVTIRLMQLYRDVDPLKRAVFDDVLADWVRSTDSGKWFDAKALIGEFRICSAMPAVRAALAYWRGRLEQFSDMRRGGEYGLQRSCALSGVDMLEPVLRDLEAACG